MAAAVARPLTLKIKLLPIINNIQKLLVVVDMFEESHLLPKHHNAVLVT